MIKSAACILSPIIASLINKSILSGIFPSQLKCAKVFPIFKGGVKSDPTNYRPISMREIRWLCFLSRLKILDKIVFR